MSLQNLQGVGKLAELIEKAKNRGQTESIDASQEKKGKGLEFMSLRLQVAEKHLELAVTKKITPAEDNLLKILEIGSIGARNSRKQIVSRYLVHISDLSAKLGYKEKAKIWRILKSLHSKGIITREKTRDKDQEIIGLDPKLFGQILSTRQHEKEKKRHLSLVKSCG